MVKRNSAYQQDPRMHIPGLTTATLLELNELIRGCLNEDDKLPKGSKKYEVRENRDWRQQADAIEAELSKRNINLEKNRVVKLSSEENGGRCFYSTEVR